MHVYQVGTLVSGCSLKHRNKLPENSHEQVFPQWVMQMEPIQISLSSSFLTKSSLRTVYHTVVADSWVNNEADMQFSKQIPNTCHMKSTTSSWVWWTQSSSYTSYFQETQARGKSAMGKIRYVPSKVQELLGMCILIRNLAYMRTSLIFPYYEWSSHLWTQGWA